MKSMFGKITNWKQKHNGLLFYILMLIWPMAHFLVSYVGVNFNSFLLAFQQYVQTESEWKWVGLDNFRRVWNEFTQTGVLRSQLINSVVMWFFGNFLVMVLTIFISYYIYKKYRMSGFFRIILFIPSILPGIILVMIYKIFMNEATPALFAEFGMQIEPLVTLSSPSRIPMIILYNMLVGFGVQMLVYTSTMSQISPSVIEAGMMDGITPMRELCSIVIPMIFPTITTYFIAGLATLFSNQANLLAFFEYEVFASERTIGYELFTLINGQGNGLSQYGYASAVGMCCSVITLVVTFIARHFLAKKED